jgi:hypothetical protein
LAAGAVPFASLAPAEVVMSEELLRERRDEAGDE